MDRGAWWAAISGITRVEHDRVTNTSLIFKDKNFISVLYFSYQGCIFENLITLNLFCSIQFLSLLSGEITAL